MSIRARFFFFSWLLLLVACGGDPAPTTANNNLAVKTDTTTTAGIAPLTPPEKHSCSIAGEVLEDNQIWLRDINTLVAIVADSTTYDPELGDSHRTLLTYNTKDCRLTKRIQLPINVSPDYAYYLAKVNYNNGSKLVGITAFNSVYLYDAEKQELLDPVRPVYLADRRLDDANSGLIQHLELWENYMVGYAQDGGAFVIDVTDKDNPQPTPAFAEYQLSDGSYSSLFLLPSEGAEQQIIVPRYDYEEGTFLVNPIFTRPRDLNTQISKGARNNRYIILRENDSTQPATVIDLVERQQVELPTNIGKQNAKNILEWVKKNR